MRVVIDGNIGSGKSTQVGMLSQMGFKCYKEPIHDWPLDLFYKDQSRWGFLLQMKILESYSDPADDCIYERCMQSSKDVFWYNLVVNNVVTRTEDNIYTDWYRKTVWKPEVTIYLRSLPEECYKKIQNREQAGDRTISLDYLRQIHDYYQLMAYKNKDYHVIDVDGKNPQTILGEILSVLKSENAMFLVNTQWT